MEEKRTPAVGDVVMYHDSLGVAHNALVTAVWSETCINVVFISDDESRRDSYGRQIERQTSLLHAPAQPAFGMYWRWAEETPNPHIAPLAV
jgi:hypothetical protein